MATKTILQRRICSVLGLIGLGGVVLLWIAGAVQGQLPVGGGGFDANPQVGSGGRNAAVSGGFDYGYGNRVISGNVGAGKAFRGVGGISDPSSFHANLGSSALGSFVRDSYGMQGNSSNLGVAQPFYLPSNTVLGVRGITSGLASPGSSMPSSMNLAPPPGNGPGQALDSRVPIYGGSGPVDSSVDLRPVAARPIVETASNLFGIQRFDVTGRAIQQGTIAGQGTYGATMPPGVRAREKAGEGGPSFQALPIWARPVEGTTSEQTGMGVALPAGTTAEQYGTQGAVERNVEESKRLLHESSNRSVVTNVMDIYEQMQAEDAAKQEAGRTAAPSGPPIATLPKATEDQDAAKQLAQKLQVYNTFVSKKPSTFDEQMARGEGLLKQGAYYRAALAYEQAINIEPNNPLGYLGRAYSLAGAGDLVSAADSLVMALEIYPEQANRSIDLPAFYPSPGEVKRITDKLTALAEAKKDDARVRLLLGYMYYYSGQGSSAKTVLDEAVKLAKEDPRVSADFVSIIERFAQDVGKKVGGGSSD